LLLCVWALRLLFHSLEHKIRTRERERLGDTQHKVVWTVLCRGPIIPGDWAILIISPLKTLQFTQQRFSLPLASGNKLNEGVERDESEIMFFLCRSMPPPTHFVFNRELISFFWEIFISLDSDIRYFSRPLSFLFTFIFDEKDVRLVRASGLMKRKESGR
jgi:hypothetical protein